MTRVLLADDHAMFRELLRIALPRNNDVQIVGEADDGQTLCEMLPRARPDVLLLDYKMPRMRDFGSLIGELRELYPQTEIIVLSGFSTPEVVACAAEAGARGYVLKSTRLHALAEAIRTVASGGVWIDPNLSPRAFNLFQRHSVDSEASHPGMTELTRREREVLTALADGLGNRSIARKLCISEDTVKTHLTRIFAKLGVKNRVSAALVFYGREGQGAATPEPQSIRAASA